MVIVWKVRLFDQLCAVVHHNCAHHMHTYIMSSSFTVDWTYEQNMEASVRKDIEQFGLVVLILALLVLQCTLSLCLAFLQVQPRLACVIVTTGQCTATTHLVTWNYSHRRWPLMTNCHIRRSAWLCWSYWSFQCICANPASLLANSGNGTVRLPQIWQPKWTIEWMPKSWQLLGVSALNIITLEPVRGSWSTEGPVKDRDDTTLTSVTITIKFH